MMRNDDKISGQIGWFGYQTTLCKRLDVPSQQNRTVCSFDFEYTGTLITSLNDVRRWIQDRKRDLIPDPALPCVADLSFKVRDIRAEKTS